jgi:hypothetical protein
VPPRLALSQRDLVDHLSGWLSNGRALRVRVTSRRVARGELTNGGGDPRACELTVEASGGDLCARLARGARRHGQVGPSERSVCVSIYVSKRWETDLAHHHHDLRRLGPANSDSHDHGTRVIVTPTYRMQDQWQSVSPWKAAVPSRPRRIADRGSR